MTILKVDDEMIKKICGTQHSISRGFQISRLSSDDTRRLIDRLYFENQELRSEISDLRRVLFHYLKQEK